MSARLNLAAVYVKQAQEKQGVDESRVVQEKQAAKQAWRGARDKARQVLEVDASNVKARYRLGLALKELGEFEGATVELKAALKADPKNREVRKAWSSLMETKKALKEKDKKVYGGMFKKLAGFASENREVGEGVGGLA